jgi:ABC-2 type transport system ATP-binding protein
MISIKNVSKSYGTKLVLITLVFILKKGRFTALLVKMVLGNNIIQMYCWFRKTRWRYHLQLWKTKEFLGYLQTEPYFFSKITGNEYLRLLCNARNIEQQDLTEKNILIYH